MKNLLFLPICFMVFWANAQVNKVSIQASGLTCSMCSNSINKAIRTLDYVKEVEADIKNSSFEVTFNDPYNVNFDQLKKKVEDAGFFVARFEASMVFNHEDVFNDAHLRSNGYLLHFLKVPEKNLTGEVKVRLLDKGFVSAKEFKKNSSLTKMDCYKTGLTAACCKLQNQTEGSRIYHVTLP